MSKGGIPAWGRVVSRRRQNPLVRRAAHLCRRYLDWYGNLNYDPATNGESFVLATLGRFQPRILFDGGANVGEWSIAAAARCPGAEIHAFEISPPTFEVLQKNTGAIPVIRCCNAGLSDSPGTIRIRHYEDMPALTTATSYPHPLPFVEKEAAVVSGDAYCADHGIDHIDFLKLDVEGMEEKVLRGFGGMLERKAIDLVQFEYGRVSIVTHFLLSDFYGFFNELGYRVGKIFPNQVTFREYDMADEDFVGPNFLACRQDHPVYLNAFGNGA